MKPLITLIWISLFLLFGLFFSTGCGNNSNQSEKIIIAGKVVNDKTGAWPNDRLVLLYLNRIGNRDAEEIGRNITSLSEYPTNARLNGIQGSNGKIDGIFVLETNNTHGLTVDILSESNKNRTFQYATRDCFLIYCQSVITHWISQTLEGGVYTIPIKSKNIEYVVKVIEGEVSSLPAELQSKTPTRLRDGNKIIAPVAVLTNTTAITNDPNLQVRGVNYRTKAEDRVLNKFTVPLNNCSGTVRITQKYTQSQTLVRQFTAEIGIKLGVDIPIAAWLKLLPELQAKYGFEQGQIDTQTIEYNMAAEPKTAVTYIVTWKEVWESGTAEVASGTNVIAVPFRVKKDLVYDVQSESTQCN